LAMVELMLPESQSNTLTHFGGLGALINMYSPEVFETGDFHVIFVGCRPVLLLQALTARKSTFLGLEEWLRIPFRKHPPSEMQTLLGDIAILPSILEAIDHLQSQGPDPAPSPSPSPSPDPSELKAKLSEVLACLSKWDGHFEIRQKRSARIHIHNDHSRTSTSTFTPVPDFWFPNLLAANISIHVWAFQIICLAELSKLNKRFPSGEACDDYNCNLNNPTTTENASLEKQHKHKHKPKIPPSTPALALATKICQSMEYMLQDEMLLYGPAAAMWPLATAYTVSIQDGDGNKEETERCWGFMGRIRERGFLSVGVGGLEVR